jgi:hypothetical protein
MAIDPQLQTSGIYLLKVTAENHSEFFKLAKN